MVLYFLEMAPEADFRYSNWVQRIWSSNVANLSFNQSTCLELSKWYWLGVWKTRADTPIFEVKTTAKILQSLAKQSSAKNVAKFGRKIVAKYGRESISVKFEPECCQNQCKAPTFQGMPWRMSIERLQPFFVGGLVDDRLGLRGQKLQPFWDASVDQDHGYFCGFESDHVVCLEVDRKLSL